MHRGRSETDNEMKQIIQDVRSGATSVREIPAPLVSPGQVLVAAAVSAISAGTERYVVDLAKASLLGKARQRPQDVKRVLAKMREEGIRSTLQQVSAKLNDPMPLGYSAAGIVIECGAGVQEFKPGDRVAAATPHSALATIGRNRVARIPDNVTFEQAAYTSIAAIGLQGVRLAKVSLGETVLVIGLGLIGQMCVCMFKAQGCRVVGTDPDPARRDLAMALGADAVAAGAPGAVEVDAVVITAATASNEPIEIAAEACRRKGRIVLVGVVGLNIPRPPFFKKELEFTVSYATGPGSHDPVYEEKGIDYPLGHVRWTAQRNMQAVLDLMAAGKLPVERLTSHRFPVDRASEAYELITARKEPFLGIVIEYGDQPDAPKHTLRLKAAPAVSGALGVSLIGAGNFARLVMLPILAGMEGLAWRGICTARGITAENTGRRGGFEFATTDAEEILNDNATSAVFIATRHDLHAGLVIAALRAGKHVFVEKPLCISAAQLAEIAATVEELGDRCPMLTVGFNRRFAPAVARVRKFFGTLTPLSLTYRFAPPYLPKEHWTQDPEVGGGRLIGEACHAVDTCVAIAGSAPVKVFAESVGAAQSLETTDDRTAITIRHANGSVSVIRYEAGGDSGFPMERIEALGRGKTAVVNNWQEGELWSTGKCEKFSAEKDKGHRTEFATFLEACRKGGDWPIPWAELYGVTWASIAAVESLRDGGPIYLES